jgi:hypothetical protein
MRFLLDTNILIPLEDSSHVLETPKSSKRKVLKEMPRVDEDPR